MINVCSLAIASSYKCVSVQLRIMSRTIIVTGGSKGLGLECVRSLLQTFQCNVVVLSRSVSSKLEDLKTKHEGKLSLVQGDVAEDSDQKVLSNARMHVPK